MPSSRNWKPTWRRAVVYAAVALFLSIADPRTPTLELGLAVAAGGETIRLWATGHLVKNDRLTRSGPYAHVRNPLYLGTLLILVGFSVAGSSSHFPGILVPLCLLPLGLAIFFGYYMPRKLRIESDRLVRRFGADAAEYIAAVPSLVPRRRPARLGPGEPSFFATARVVSNNEHLTLLAVALGAAALVLKRAALSP
jgi:hypothetical protein